MEVFDRCRCGWTTEDVDSEVKVGERIAQLIIEKIMTPDVAEVEDLDLTLRCEGGIGSTRCKAHVLGFGCSFVLCKFVFIGDEVVPGMHAGLVGAFSW
ncbi:hypothetical protein EUGRSUZ_C01497 [Eucalyptus grandis]|uniref:Uncharacterized protein n=3 Tax=Eucalyptus TaxID=3932 RepID=A0ACC3LCU1_EUCGR|nr:hypothetical protein EUGRSUZ_C01497 [Eucalyptus grandis]